MTSERRDALRDKIAATGAQALLLTKLVNVRYLSGFTGSNAQLLIGTEDLFFTDGRYEEQSARQVPDCTRTIYSGGVGFTGLFARALQERGIERVAVEAHHMTLATAGAVRAAAPEVALVETTGLVESLRLRKSPDEVEALRRACAIGDAALEMLLGRLVEGMTETDLAAELEDAMRRSGSEGLSFDTIVAFGENAAEPHHHPATKALRRGDLVKLDFGATWGGYHADMTRTIAFGKPGDEHRRIYGIVRDAQEAGLAAVRAGAACRDVDRASRDVVESAGYGFGHGTGHGVGLEVHEAPSVRKESADTLAEGMAVTVEPGIYVPGFAGVRIEDTVVVSADGCDILTRSPKELIEV